MATSPEHAGHTYEDMMLSEDCDYDALTEQEVLAEAKALYDECPTVKPSWDQLGEVTKSVWVGYVMAGRRAEVLW